MSLEQVSECTVEVLCEVVDGKLRLTIIGLPNESPFSAQDAVTEVRDDFLSPRDETEHLSRRNLDIAVKEIQRERGVRPPRRVVAVAWNSYVTSRLEITDAGVFQRLDDDWPRTVADWIGTFIS